MSQLLVLVSCLCIGLMAGCWLSYLALVPGAFATLAISFLFSDSGGVLPFWLSAGFNVLALQAAYLVSALTLRPWMQKRLAANERAKSADAAKRETLQSPAAFDASSASQACATGNSAAPEFFPWAATARKKSGVQP